MPAAQPEVRLKGVLESTTSWVRILDDGRIELEYYDFSSDAEAWFGHDIAWMYHIDPSEKPRIYERLAAHSRTRVIDDESLLAAFATSFADVKQIRDWLKQEGIPFEEQFESWA